MEVFDPKKDVINSQLILQQGEWPNFHDAEIQNLNIWRGDVRPEDNVWIGPIIEASFELCALEKPFIALLKFHDCSEIRLQEFDHQNALFDLRFQYQSRGELRDGNPLTPWIKVEFEQLLDVAISFKCFNVEVVEKKIIR